MAWGVIAKMVVSGVMSYLSSQKQTDALNAASKGQTEIQRQYLQLYKEMMAEGAFERGVASASRIRALQALGDEVMRPVGTSPEFLRASKKGMETLARQYAAVGLVSGGGGSSAFGRASGEFMGELTAKDYTLKRNTLMQLTGLGPPSTTPTQAAQIGLGGATAAATNIANLGLERGRISADFYKDIGSLAQSGLSRVDWGGMSDWFKTRYNPNGTTEGAPDLGY